MRYLIDSDWVIDCMRGYQPTIRLFDELSDYGVGISAIAVAELYYGIFRALDPEKEERDINLFIDGLDDIVPLERESCMIFAKEKRRLESLGLSLDIFDLLIGSTAIHHGFTLLTNNRRHYERMEGLHFITSR